VKGKTIHVELIDGSHTLITDDAGYYFWLTDWRLLEDFDVSVSFVGDSYFYPVSASSTLFVGSLNQPPICSITRPQEGAQIQVQDGGLIFEGLAFDPDSGDSVEQVYVKLDDSKWLLATGTTNWRYEWTASGALNGTHTLSVKAYDGVVTSDPMSITVTVGISSDAPLDPTMIRIPWPWLLIIGALSMILAFYVIKV
jgi:hypothetical protein